MGTPKNMPIFNGLLLKAGAHNPDDFVVKISVEKEGGEVGWQGIPTDSAV